MDKNRGRPSGFIFGCTPETIRECLNRGLFGLPAQYKGMVAKIRPTVPVFLFDFQRRELLGGFQACSFGGYNLDTSAFGGRFPSQVRVIQTEIFPSVLSENVFGEVIKDNYYYGHRFKYELTTEQVRRLQGLFRSHSRLGSLPKRGQRVPASPAPKEGKRARMDAVGNQGLLDKNTIRSEWLADNVSLPSRVANRGTSQENWRRQPHFTNALSTESLFQAPVDPGSLIAGMESRTTVALGPVPIDLSASDLVAILDSLQVDRYYDFFLVTKVMEAGHRYCVLNIKDVEGVRRLVNLLHCKTWSVISGQKIAQDSIVEIAFCSFQGLDNLVLEFGDHAHWLTENLTHKSIAALSDGMPLFFCDRGTQQDARTAAPEMQGAGDGPTGSGANLEELVQNMDFDISHHYLQPFAWESTAGVKTENGEGVSERIKEAAMLCFQQDLERVLTALQKQDRRVARALKLKYKPLQKFKDTDPNHPFYEEAFRAISKEVDDRMGSTGLNQGRLQRSLAEKQHGRQADRNDRCDILNDAECVPEFQEAWSRPYGFS